MKTKGMDRLFAQLCTEPFNDFRRLGKEYEIRAYGGKFTEKCVYSGRLVELRHGYSLRDDLPESEWQLWGNISKVYTGTLDEIFNQVDYKLCEPRCDSREIAIQENIDILSKKDIAFEIVNIRVN